MTVIARKENGPRFAAAKVFRSHLRTAFPPREKHWHGDAHYSHDAFAVQGQLNGKFVDRMEKVSDEQYHK
jgi:hypothetical protein